MTVGSTWAGKDVLELVDAVHALGVLLREHEAAEGRLEVLAARPVGHAAQARAIPVDLARLRVEGALLAGILLQSFGRALDGCGSLGVGTGPLGSGLLVEGLVGGLVGLGLDLLALLLEDGVDGGQVVVGEGGGRGDGSC